MSKYKKIIIPRFLVSLDLIRNLIMIVFSLSLLVQCNKAESEKNSFKNYNTKEVLGVWKIVPSYNGKIIFNKDERNFLIRENEKIEIFAVEDVRGVRLQYRLEDDSPFAYFLFSEKSKNIWGGVLDNKVVRIVREVTVPESILE
ncbi:MAG: hypothetical protein IPL26_29570 [Leptospiraceae bacterium]|nr:hypothetical protein [Leptospiraceae bacterium]